MLEPITYEPTDHPMLESFLRAYIECALWSSTDDDGEPYDAYASAADLAPETRERMLKDCYAFISQHGPLLTSENYRKTSADDPVSIIQQAGYDFWLNRNGHGAGFWDGDWETEVGETLDQASHAFGECDLYTGDDGKLYLA